MKNAILSVIFFMLIMICVFFLNNSIIKLCDNVLKESELIEENIKNNELDEAYKKSLNLLDYINEKNSLPYIYISHQELDNLLNEIVKLTTYLNHEDTSEAHTSLHLIKYNSNHLKKLQIPSLDNIL